MANIPEAELVIDADLVSRLLAAQCPHLDDPHVEAFAHGWDNEIFALGPSLLVRLPRREAAAHLIEHEVAALPRLAPLLPAPVPVPVFAGQPSAEYPWCWTVVPRLPGTSAADRPPADRDAAAPGLAEFLAALHRPAPESAPANPFRGVPLAARQQGWEPRITQVAGDAAWERWQQAASAPEWVAGPVWLHGDPHPMNLLLHADGSLAGVIDFGDVCSGDPASDLAVAWLMFTPGARRTFRDEYTRLTGARPQLWSRAWAWALGLSAVFAQASDNLPALAGIAAHGLTQTLADPEFGTA